MNSDITYDINAQTNWLNNSFAKEDYYHWIIQFGGKDIGLINFTDWDRQVKSVSWGLYISDDEALGIGGIMSINSIAERQKKLKKIINKFCANTVFIHSDLFRSSLFIKPSMNRETVINDQLNLT